MPNQPTRDDRDSRSPKKGSREPKPTGTKGEELSSQGQLDEGSRKREKSRETPPVIGEP